MTLSKQVKDWITDQRQKKQENVSQALRRLNHQNPISLSINYHLSLSLVKEIDNFATIAKQFNEIFFIALPSSFTAKTKAFGHEYRLNTWMQIMNLTFVISLSIISHVLSI